METTYWNKSREKTDENGGDFRPKIALNHPSPMKEERWRLRKEIVTLGFDGWEICLRYQVFSYHTYVTWHLSHEFF